MQPQPILHFWFTKLPLQAALRQRRCLGRNPICTCCGTTLETAARCELFAWHATPEGRLAEVWMLYQLSRNVYRDTPCAFAQDALALALTARAGGHRARPQPDRCAA